jgi:hypothetical protein
MRSVWKSKCSEASVDAFRKTKKGIPYLFHRDLVFAGELIPRLEGGL